MKRAIFLGRIKDDDRDCCKYITVDGFECGHYFGGLHVQGACFSGFETEFRELITNDFGKFETILTQEECLKLFEINDRLKALGFGIKQDSEKYFKGLDILKEFDTIINKLSSEENDVFFKKIQESEKEYCMQEFDLTMEEIDKVFNEYQLEYRDRAIIGGVFKDRYDLGEEEKWNFGYDNLPYFDTNAFVEDLLNNESYLELDSGKIVAYNY